MTNLRSESTVRMAGLLAGLVILLTGCGLARHGVAPQAAPTAQEWEYLIGPGDSLNIFVWRNAELSTSVSVRPDGKFSAPLVEDLQASGKTPTQLAREIETALGEYVRDPLVTVTIGGYVGEYYAQIRVIGEAAKPLALPYRKNMTVLDLMIAVGGLTEYAAGNRSTLVRIEGGRQTSYRVRLDDLIRKGDISANVDMAPGDIVIIPEAYF